MRDIIFLRLYSTFNIPDIRIHETCNVFVFFECQSIPSSRLKYEQCENTIGGSRSNQKSSSFRKRMGNERKIDCRNGPYSLYFERGEYFIVTNDPKIVFLCNLQ